VGEVFMAAEEDSYGANEECLSFENADPWHDAGGEPVDGLAKEPHEVSRSGVDAATSGSVDSRLQEQPHLTCRVCDRAIEGVYYEVGGELACAYCRELIGISMSKGSPGLRFIGASGLGFVAAVLGGALCFVLVGVVGKAGDVSNFGFGFLAIVVAFFVGKAVKIGSRGKGGWVYQGMAACLTYCAIVATFIPVVHRWVAEESQARAASPAGLTAAQSPPDPHTASSGEDGMPSIVWEDMPFIEKVLDCVFLYAAAFVSPFLACLGIAEDWRDVMWPLFALFAVVVAGYQNRRLLITIDGPYNVATAGMADRVSGLTRGEEQ
jgi:hypothetical protein